MLTAKLKLERFDKGHRLLETIERPSRSFTLGFIQFLYLAHAQITNGAPYSMNDVTGAARLMDNYSSSSVQVHYEKTNLMLAGPPGLTGIFPNIGTSSPRIARAMVVQGELVGVQVGTGVVAVAPDDEALGTRIVHGRGAGEFEYGGSEMVNMVFAAPNCTFDIRRYFTNLSGGGITVEEVGLYALGTKNSPADEDLAYPFLVARDLTGGVAVADTELLRVTYTPQITV